MLWFMTLLSLYYMRLPAGAGLAVLQKSENQGEGGQIITVLSYSHQHSSFSTLITHMEDAHSMSPPLTDQLSLPVDVVGALLLLLSDQDIQRVRLVCQAWLAAVDHQIRVLQPLHLPQQPSTAVFSSCERVQAPVLRHAGGQTTASAQQHADAAEFCWDAPIRHVGSMCGSMQHAAELDLSGQRLPPGCLQQLAQHMTRLRCLKLEASTFPAAAELCDLAAFAAQAAGGASGAGAVGGLSQLSLAGVQVSTNPAAGSVRPGQSPAAAALAAAAARLSGNSNNSGSSNSVGVREVLSAIATNPLTHLDLSRTAKVRAYWRVMGFRLVPLPACTCTCSRRTPAALCVRRCCAHRLPLHVLLVCLSDCLCPARILHCSPASCTYPAMLPCFLHTFCSVPLLPAHILQCSPASCTPHAMLPCFLHTLSLHTSSNVSCLQDAELLAAAGHIPAAAAQPQAQQQQQAQQMLPPLVLPVLGRCSQLARLCSSLQSLKLVGNLFNADDWQHICSRLTLLTVGVCWHGEPAAVCTHMQHFTLQGCPCASFA
jgi:hypothetical protein